MSGPPSKKETGSGLCSGSKSSTATCNAQSTPTDAKRTCALQITLTSLKITRMLPSTNPFHTFERGISQMTCPSWSTTSRLLLSSTPTTPSASCPRTCSPLSSGSSSARLAPNPSCTLTSGKPTPGWACWRGRRLSRCTTRHTANTSSASSTSGQTSWRLRTRSCIRSSTRRTPPRRCFGPARSSTSPASGLIMLLHSRPPSPSRSILLPSSQSQTLCHISCRTSKTEAAARCCLGGGCGRPTI
mmetsp:Transcript_16875/g.33798  ORF Transcript_16875/g.33798 Transcript_16875/m.33798 type:complete len:244 (+) Transcript_16875:61-792(+)